MKVFEIFDSINGEVTGWHQGSLTTFVRLAGCNLRCVYCDAERAQGGAAGTEMNSREVLDRINAWQVTITGGEPLLQAEELGALVGWLIGSKYKITIETNGTLPLQSIPQWQSYRIAWVVDYKDTESFLWDNVALLGTKDWIKFVITDRDQYASALASAHGIRQENALVNIAFSPCIPGEVSPKMLMEWLIADKAWDIILNLQIHKIIGAE